MNLHRNLGIGAAATFALGILTAGTAYAVAAPPTATAAIVQQTLTVRGTDAADHITISFGSVQDHTVTVDLGPGSLPQRFDRLAFSAVSVDLRGGDDTLATQTAGPEADAPLSVKGGAGSDSVLGGSRDDILDGGTGDDDLRGGAGRDLVFAGAGNDTVDGGIDNDVEILGGGDDVARWTPGEASDVVDGGRGQDRLDFLGSNASEIMSLGAVGDKAVLLRNFGGVRMDLDGVERVDVDAFGGADSMTVGDLAGTDVRRANLDLASTAGTPDGSVDSVVVQGTDRADRAFVRSSAGAVSVQGLHATTRVSGSEPTDQLRVSTGTGNDRVDVSATARSLIEVAIDLGSGQR